MQIQPRPGMAFNPMAINKYPPPPPQGMMYKNPMMQVNRGFTGQHGEQMMGQPMHAPPPPFQQQQHSQQQHSQQQHSQQQHSQQQHSQQQGQGQYQQYGYHRQWLNWRLF